MILRFGEVEVSAGELGGLANREEFAEWRDLLGSEAVAERGDLGVRVSDGTWRQLKACDEECLQCGGEFRSGLRVVGFKACDGAQQDAFGAVRGSLGASCITSAD